MNIKIAFTKNGPIIADFTEISDGSFQLEKPAILQPHQNGVNMFPLLGMCLETTVTLTKDEINFDQLFTPVLEILNGYNSKFGSGLQLVTT